jgi:hypothetical protein
MLEMSRPARVRVSVFLGAGASVLAGFPAVRSFFGAACPRGGVLDSLCCELARRIARDEGNYDNRTWPDFDAEKVFGWLEILDRSDRLREPDERHNISHHRDAGLPVEDLFSRLKQQIVLTYGAASATQENVATSYKSLLDLLDSLAPEAEPLCLFTTNYDRVIEQQLDDWNPSPPNGAPSTRLRLCNGFSSDRPGRWQPELFDSRPTDGGRLVHLVKLHGSVTWKRDGSDIVDTGWPQPTEHDCLLYFGYKGVPEDEPFAKLHSMLKKALLECDAFLTVGFRFADPYIRELFDFSLQANPRLRIISALKRLPEPDSPLDRMMKEFRNRVVLLRDSRGNPLPFGHASFTDAVSKAIDGAGA